MNKWIECSKEYPKNKQWVLCWDGTDIYLLCFFQITDGRHKKRSGYFDDLKSEEGYENITHWHPLPNPPINMKWPWK